VELSLGLAMFSLQLNGKRRLSKNELARKNDLQLGFVANVSASFALQILTQFNPG